MQAEAIKLAAQREGAESAIKTLEEELERIGDDPAALKVAVRVDALAGAPQPLRQRRRHPRAAGRTRREARRCSTTSCAASAARAKPSRRDCCFRSGTVGALEDLIARRSGCSRSSRRRARRAETARDAQAQALQELPQFADDRRSAAMALAEGAAHGGAARRFGRPTARRARRDRQADAEAQRSARALAPWRGDAEALARLCRSGRSGDGGTAPRACRKTNALRQQRLDRSDRQDRRSRTAEGRGGGRGARNRSSRRRGSPPTIRSAREAAWSAHRADARPRKRRRSSKPQCGATMRRAQRDWPARASSPRCASARSRSPASKRNARGRRRILKLRKTRSRALDHEIAALSPAAPPSWTRSARLHRRLASQARRGADARRGVAADQGRRGASAEDEAGACARR